MQMSYWVGNVLVTHEVEVGKPGEPNRWMKMPWDEEDSKMHCAAIYDLDLHSKAKTRDLAINCLATLVDAWVKAHPGRGV